MRKLLMLVTMLLVPALASAWTVPVKVTNTTAGIAAGNKATVSYTGLAATDVAVGTKYFYPAGSVASVSVAVANSENVTSITLDGVAQAKNTSGITTVVIPQKTLSALNIVYASATATPKCDITLNQTAGGLASLSIGKSSTTVGYTGVAVGTSVTVKAQPNAGYTLSGISVNGVPLVSPYTFVVADTTADVVTATFAEAPVITASLSLPASGQIGTPVVATVTASSPGAAPLHYAWTLNGAAVGSDINTYSLTPAAGGNTVEVAVSSADAATVVKSATLMGTDVVGEANYSCTSCHSGNTPAVVAAYNASAHEAAGSTCTTCHSTSAHTALADSNTCATCHTDARTEFRATAHWNNHLEYGPEFTGGAVEGQLNANDSYTTKEDGVVVTCAYRCHFRPGQYPADVTPPAAYMAGGKSTTYVKYVDSLNGKTYTRPGGDECIACHDAHNPQASYQTCLTCHTGSRHGKVPNEFWGSKHWQNNFEFDPATQRNQTDTTVAGGNVKDLGTKTDGYLNANDSYTTEELGKTGWATVTCAYNCHFRPGMGPQKDVTGQLVNGKAVNRTRYTDTTGKYGPAGTVYSRPGGDACMACHNEHSLEATAQSTCYTCHTGSVTSHGWSVAAFEKSSHFTGATAKADGMDKEACLACHNAHSTEAEFANLSTAKVLHTAGMVTGCQKCHNGTAEPSIFNADGTGKAPHFQTNAPGADGYYPTGSYDGGGATCVECHYHNNTINAGWAKGGHASTTSVPLVTSAADNWNRGTKKGANISTDPVTTYGGDYTQQASVSDCQRCHTAKGFIQFYDSAFKNVSTVREGITTSAPITCDACHVPKTLGTLMYNGKVRPLATGVTNVKTYVGNAKHLPTGTTEQTAFMTFSSAGVSSYKNSNVCIPCHAGRGTGALIKKTFAAGSESATLARDIIRIGTDIYAHFASAAGVVNGSSAYEYSTPALTNSHMKIGIAGTATQGPCVGCHMTSTEGHSLESVTFAADGTINGFATTLCVSCHGVTAPALTPADVQTKKENFEAALNMLRNLLLERGFDALQAEIDARPGERMTMDMSLGYDAYVLAGGALSKKDFAERNTGAAFNWWQFGKSFKDGKTIVLGDPAAYVHNPIYAKEVIMESMDWLDDFQLNNSITAAQIDALAAHPLKLYGGVADGVAADPAKAKAYFGL